MPVILGACANCLSKCRFVVNYDDARGHERRFPSCGV